MTTESKWLPLIPDRSSPADLSDVAVLALSDQLPALIAEASSRWPVLPDVSIFSGLNTNRYSQYLSVSRGVQVTTNDSGVYAHAEVTCSVWSPRNFGSISAHADYSGDDANFIVMTNSAGQDCIYTMIYQDKGASYPEIGNIICDSVGFTTPEISVSLLLLLGIAANDFNPIFCNKILTAMIDPSTARSRSAEDMFATLRKIASSGVK